MKPEKIEEKMYWILGRIAECERIIREADEAIDIVVALRQQLYELTKEYQEVGGTNTCILRKTNLV